MHIRKAAAVAVVTAAFAFQTHSGLRAQSTQASTGVAGSGLNVPFTTTGTGNGGTVPVSGVFRITQFVEQAGRAWAAGTLAIGESDATTPRTVVRQVLVPVLHVSSATSSSSLTLALGPSSSAPGFPVGFSAVPTSTVPETTTGTGTTTSQDTTAVAGTAGSAVPGVQANCGPLHLELGPIDESAGTVAFHLDRLVVELAAPVGMVSSVSSAMCTADVALSQAAGNSTASASATTTGTLTGATAAGTFLPSFGSSTLGTSSPASTTSATVSGTPLQQFVAALNQVVGLY
jgi:hypothetical protein